MTSSKSTPPESANATRARTRSTTPAKRSASQAMGAETATKPAKAGAPGPRRTSASRKPTSPRAPVLDAQERHALVAQAAYFIAQSRGFAPGHELHDWYAAEADVDARLAAADAEAVELVGRNLKRG